MTSLPANIGLEMGDSDINLEDQEIAGIDMVHLDQAYQKQQLYTIPPDQLCKVNKVFLNSLIRGSAQASKNIGIKKETSKEQHKPR
jgi:hypothetical protein